ncbi:MAG: AAA family ATPase [Deltaproteobacteria bacterium]|nr:AAA family ATPase [Deltaproteobacteria bacterium]
MKKLPVGIADFATIRKGGYYADKTKLLYKIIQWPVPYFLSRPRRFGKTVLVDSLEYLL